MNLNPSKLIPKGITRSAAKAVLQTKENSPHIFFGLGIVAVVGGTYLACKATLKAPEVLDAGKETIEKAKAEAEPLEAQLDLREEPEYDNIAEFEGQVKMAKVYGGVALEVARLYAPAVIVIGVGVGCLTGAHIQLHRRNVALTMAFGSLSQAFKEYRARVRNLVGPEKELDVYRGVETVKVQGPNGIEEMKVYTGQGRSPYAFQFNRANSSSWVDDAETNWMFIELAERRLNQRLNQYGYVFLSDVLDFIGLEQTEESRVVGWMVNSELGDGFISFGVPDMATLDFVDEVEGVWFDFNVDGPIHTKALEKGGTR